MRQMRIVPGHDAGQAGRSITPAGRSGQRADRRARSADVPARSPEVPVISFTGCTRTWQETSAAAAPNRKRPGPEPGGKAPMIVLDDADSGPAIPKIVQALTTFAGQFCMTGSRLPVQAGVADQVQAPPAERLTALRAGPATHPAREMGHITERRRNRVGSAHVRAPTVRFSARRVAGPTTVIAAWECSSTVSRGKIAFPY